MNKLKKIRFEVISENIINNININEIEFGNLKFYSKNNRTNNINITTNLDFNLISNNNNTYTPKIQKIKLQGISGTRDQNPDIREFEFIGLGKWGTGDRRTGDYKINVTTNMSTAQYPESPTVYLNNWVDGLITSHSNDNSKYLSGNNVSITDTSYILFDLVGNADKPKLTDFDQFLIYYDRQDMSVDSNQGKWKLIIIDENDIEHTVISTMTFYENDLITDYNDIYFLKFDTNIKSYYQNNSIISNNTNDYNLLINGNYDNNMLRINYNNYNLNKFIEFDLDNTYNIPNLLNALSYTKIYSKHNNYVYTEERIYPSEKARLHYFDKIDGNSSDVYNIKYSNYANGYYEIHYSKKDTKIFQYDFDNDNGDYTITFDESTTVDILLVGGGGGGGNSIGGGGGAGGLIFIKDEVVSSGTYNIKIGKGGVRSTSGRDYGRNGQDSTFLTYTAYGGGGGTGQSLMYDSDLLNRRNSLGLVKNGKGGQDGGSGAGGTRHGNTPGNGVSNQGNRGGYGSNNNPWSNRGGGGGGAGGSGYNSHTSNNLGTGGIGLSEKSGIDFKTHFNITDKTIGDHYDNKVYFAGGGAGGQGGGGKGGGGNMNSAAKNNTGGGGGGGNGGNGGSGILIIRYNNNNSPHNIFSSKKETYHHNDSTWTNNQYNLGKYIGNHNFANLGYKGDWITIKMPVRIIPTKIRFVSILFNTNYIDRLPKKYRLYGYYENKWELIINDTISDDYEYESYNSVSNIAYTKNITNAKNYNYFSLIVNEINGANLLAMSNFEIFGREIVNNNNDIFSLTGFDNWLKIKHLPARNAGSSWYSGNTFNLSNINGSYTIGTKNDDTQEWAISFNPDNVEYYLFITRDSHYDSEYKDRWIMIESNELKKFSDFNSSYGYSYANVYIHHYKSSINPNGFQDKTGDFYEFNDQIMYNRGDSLRDGVYDPNISIKHSKIYGTYTDEYPYTINHNVFIEKSTTNWGGAPPVICEVYVKYKEVNINELYYTNKIHRLQYDAEIITKLDGWKLVRYLNNGMTSVFKSTDNLVGTDIYGNKDDFTKQWSIEFQSGNYDEYLFVGGNFEDWIIIHKDEFIPLNGSYNNYITALKSSINDNEHLVKAATDTPNDRPLIALTEWGDNKHLYQESETGTLQFGIGTYADRPYYVFVRKSNKFYKSNNNLFLNNEKVYTSERMYPPTRNLSSSSHTISGEIYGNGVYETWESTYYSTSYKGFSAFQESVNVGYHALGYQYNTSGDYLKSNYILSDYLGDWIKIKMPIKIHLTKYGFKARSSTYISRTPNKYKIYGSNNGTDWTELVHKKNTDVSLSYSNMIFEENIIMTTKSYHYFALVVNKLIGGSNCDCLNFDEWYIYGKEEVPFTLYNNITESNEKIISLTHDESNNNHTEYNLLLNNDTMCDILVVGGGGGGGEYGGGGGGGDVIYKENILLNAGDYKIKVGKGGTGGGPGFNYEAGFSGYYSSLYFNEDFNIIAGEGGGGNSYGEPADLFNSYTYNINNIIYYSQGGGAGGDTEFNNNNTGIVSSYSGNGGNGIAFSGGGAGGGSEGNGGILTGLIAASGGNGNIINITGEMIGYGGGGGGGSLGTYNGGDGIHGGGNGSKEGDIEATAGINGKGGGGGGSIILQKGLKYEYYNQGYFRDNVNWFNSYNPHSTGYVTDGTNIGTFSNNTRTSNSGDSYSFQWTGYFKATTTGTYVFYTQSDDASYLWIGSNAISGYTTSNAIVNNGGTHGVRDRNGSINLTENSYYPIRIQFGENNGGDDMRVSFKPPGGSRTYNGDGYYYSISNSSQNNQGGSGIVIIKIKYIYNYNYNNIEFKTSIFDNENNKIELNNTIINHEKLIHGIENGVLTSYNITKYNLFKEERLYPPYHKTEILLFENFFIENKLYGNGNYSIEYSSNYDENNKPFNIFRNNYYNGMWKLNNYTWNNQPLNTLSARSSFNGSTYIQDSTYKGDWITINLPYKIILTKFIIVLMNSNQLNISKYDNAIYYFPHNFRIYGRNKNEEWELIIHKNINKTNLNNKYDNINNLNVAFEYKLSDNDRLTKFKTFEKFALVVSEIGGKEYLNFSKWDLYGKELNNNEDNNPDNIPYKKNVKFSQLSKVFDNKYNNKNIKIKNYYLDNLDNFDFNTSIPNDGIISLSNFKGSSSFIDNIPLQNNIYARYQPNYESLFISDNIVKNWYDSSGNNRHITTYRGNPILKYFEKGSKGTTGTNYFNIIYGDTNSGYKLPFRLNFEYTFCYVARYVGDKNNTTYNRRIFDSSAGTGQNTLWGFHSNHSGKSHNYKSGWHTTTHKQHSETDYWMIGVETQNTSRYNGQDCTNYYEYKGSNYPLKYSDYNTQLTINYGYYTGESYSTETSNWEIAELIFYDKELNLDEKISVEKYLAEKYGHISFSNVVNLDQYKSIIKSHYYKNDLSDMWYYIYDGHKYGYSDITYKFYGPANFRFILYKYIDDDDTIKYYWIADFINTYTTYHNTSYNNRNGNIKNYIFKNINSDAKISIVSGGGGGGGGGYNNRWGYQTGGGGAGGQSYIYDYLQTNTINYNIQVGSKGNGGNNNTYDSSGGDSIVTWIDNDISYNITGYGGYEGETWNVRGQGGNYYIYPNLSNIGGSVGGNSIHQQANRYGGSYYNRNPGGAISSQLKNITLNSGVIFWNILDEFFGNWSNRNVRYHWEDGKYYGAGGSGGQNGAWGESDPVSRPGYSGGPGYVFMILDFNDIQTSTSNISSVENNTNSTSSY